MDAGAGVGSLPSCFPYASQKPNAQGQCTERPCEANVPTRCFYISGFKLLDREPGRALKTLHGIEHKPRDARRASRVDISQAAILIVRPKGERSERRLGCHPADRCSA